jgi:hypothetical protein
MRKPGKKSLSRINFIMQKHSRIKIGMGHTLMLLLLTKANLNLKIMKSFRITGIVKLNTYLIGKR